MNKIFLSFVVSGSLLASNYKLVPLSSDGIALSSSNLAKSFSADAAFINPANMGFLGENPKLHFSTNYYNIVGAKFENTLHDIDGEPYYNADDAKGKEFSFILPTVAFVYPINDKHFIGASLYTDFAGVYGWNSDYAKALTDTMDIRGGTAAISYAYKPTSEISIGAALTLNHTKLKFNLIKDNAKNPRYEPTEAIKPSDKVWYDNDGKAHPYTWVYDNIIKADNGYKLGYKLALSYVPKYFDDKLRFSFVYNSSYKNDFKGNMNFNITKFAMDDFLALISSDDADDSIADTTPSFTGDVELVGIDVAITALMSEVATRDAQGNKIPLASQNEKIGYNGPLSANFLYPASANIGIAYEYGKHEFMLNIGKTFWSKAKPLEIKIQEPSTPKALEQAIGQIMMACMQNDCTNNETYFNITNSVVQQLSKEDKQAIEEYVLAQMLQVTMDQGWKDTMLVSLGYRYNYDDELAFMLGFATEDSPVRRDRISFLAKDSRMFMYSLGLEYKLNQKLRLMSAFAYQHYADVNVNNVTDTILIQTKGKFSRQSNQIVNVGINYEF